MNKRAKIIKRYGLIYAIMNKVNKKYYIGQTVSGFDRRYQCEGKGIERVYRYHKYRKENNLPYNSHLFNAIEKYGFDNFIVIKEIDVAYSQDELNEKEKYWIAFYDSFKNGYNNTQGGEGGKKTDVLCLTTGEMYGSVSIIKNKFNCNFKAIFCPNKSQNTGKLNGKDLLWLKYEDYLQFTNGEVQYGTNQVLENLSNYLLRNSKKAHNISTEKQLMSTKQEQRRYNPQEINEYFTNKDEITAQYLTFRKDICDILGGVKRREINYKFKFGEFRKLLMKIINDLVDDMEEMEEILLDRKISFNTSNEEHDKFTYMNDIQFTDIDDIKTLIQLDKEDYFNSNIYTSIIDIDNMIEKTNLTDVQKQHIELFRQGYSISDIAKDKGISSSSVSKGFNSSIKKIKERQDKCFNDDYLYLFKQKGVYATCKKCGATKLESDFYKIKNGKYTKLVCKECRKREYKGAKNE